MSKCPVCSPCFCFCLSLVTATACNTSVSCTVFGCLVSRATAAVFVCKVSSIENLCNAVMLLNRPDKTRLVSADAKHSGKTLVSHTKVTTHLQQLKLASNMSTTVVLITGMWSLGVIKSLHSSWKFAASTAEAVYSRVQTILRKSPIMQAN